MAKAKYIMLLPVTFNDGTEVPKELRDHIFDELFILGGGYHVAGSGRGAYRMKNGAKQIDETLQVWVVVDEDDEPELKDVISKFASMLEQECIYLERMESTVDFVSGVSVGETQS